MKRQITFIFSCAVAFISSYVPMAHADFIPGRVRAISRAEMQVTQSRADFQGVPQVTLSLTRADGAESPHPTGITIEYLIPNRTAASTVGITLMKNMSYHLAITQREIDPCGSVHYEAQLPAVEENSLNHQLPLSQVYVHLVDHSHRDPQCQHQATPRAPWEASVRQNPGQRGFLNSSMLLVGEPEPLMITQ